MLAQIIFEQEGKNGQSLLPITFLRQLIRFYGDSMQMLVPSYLEFSLDKLAKEKSGFTDVFGTSKLAAGMMKNPMAGAAAPIFAQIEEQARQNVTMFRQALSMFTPVAGAIGAGLAPKPAASSPAEPQPPQFAEPPAQEARGEIDDMRRQLEEMQRRIESLVPKS